MQNIQKMEINREVGFRYNIGKPKWSLMHYKSMEPMIRVLEYGAHKYTLYEDEDGNIIKGSEVTQQEVIDRKLKVHLTGKENWKKPLDLVEIMESMQRHVAAIMDGEEFDSESGISHMGHIQCNAMFYNYHKAKLNGK